MTSGASDAGRAPLRHAATIWWTIAGQVAVLLASVLASAVTGDEAVPIVGPLVSLGVTTLVGLALLVPRRRRRLGVGLLLGATASGLLLALLGLLFLVTWFIAPGGHELS